MSDFISAYTAFSGLTAAQAGINTIFHIIANAETPGFTQQLSSLEAVMEQQMQQTAFEAALAASAQSSQSSLVDFLR